MKKGYILLFAGLINASSFFAQGWQWKNSETQPKILKDRHNDLYIFANTTAGISIKKRDLSGNVLWAKSINGGISANAYKIDISNNLVVVGNITTTATVDNITLASQSSSNFFILKISPSSTILRANVYGGSSETAANDLYINANGDYLIGGSYKGTFDVNGTLITGDTLSDFLILKTDSNQNVFWWETNGYVPGAEGSAWIDELVETSSGNICAVYSTNGLVDYKGQQNSYDGQFMVQLDAARNLIWSKYVCYPFMGYYSYSDLQAIGDTVYMKNFQYYNHIGPDAWISKWVPSGANSSKHIGNTGYLGYNVFGNKIYFAAICYNNTSWYKRMGFFNSGLSGGFSDSTVVSNNPNYSYYNYYSEMECVDSSRFYIGGKDSTLSTFVGLFELNYSTMVVSQKPRTGYNAFPNPSSGIVHLNGTKNISSVKVYNSIGGEVECFLKNSEIDLSGQPKGIYFVRFQDPSGNCIRKIILE